MQFTTVRSKEKDYDIYLKSEKLVHSQQEHEKNVSQLFEVWKKLVPSYLEPDKHCCSYLQREKSGSLLVGDQNMQFTSVRSKKIDYDIFKVRKTGSQPVRARKKCFQAIWKCIKLFPSYFQPDKHCCSYLQREKSGSLLVGDQNMQFTSVSSKKIDYDIYLKSEKLVHSQ